MDVEISMKILFLIHTLAGGGAEKVLVNLVNNLDKEKYEVTVMTIINTGINRQNLAPHIRYKSIINIPSLKKKGSESGSLLSDGGFKKKMAMNLYSFFWKIVSTKIMYKLFIREEYDVEIAFLEGITAKLLSGSGNQSSKKLAWIHVDLLNERKSEKFFLNSIQEKKCYSKFDEIVCVSNNVKESFVQKFGFDEKKVVVRYNPLETDEIVRKSEELPLVEKPADFLICTIGRLIHQKGYDRLLKVVKRLINEGHDFKLWILGDGLERLILEKYINDNNLCDYVSLLGFKENPHKYLKQADLFVCSSYAEGFSTVASEAVVLGIPVVTVDCSGMKELLGENNEYGVVTSNSEDGLYEGLASVLGSHKKRDYYQKKVIERKDFFDINKSMKNIEKLLGEVIL